jgi:hypothetical protein
MSEMTIKRGVILTAILLASLGLLFAQRLIFPLEIRLIVAAVIVAGAMSGFFAYARPARPLFFALASSILATIEAWAVFLFLHGFIVKDLDAPGVVINHVYLHGMIMVMPFIMAAQIIAARGSNTAKDGAHA